MVLKTMKNKATNLQKLFCTESLGFAGGAIYRWAYSNVSARQRLCLSGVEDSACATVEEVCYIDHQGFFDFTQNKNRVQIPVMKQRIIPEAYWPPYFSRGMKCPGRYWSITRKLLFLHDPGTVRRCGCDHPANVAVTIRPSR
ncbi:hypothetical protein SARC_03613 [Sphaeroforma arctica JP610]|uniref:Uncharacterized protein n=1 Tax=Sphaeroforma arctica JP610 TaxID=667725 RepID=A0A0L0G547_9EUKA|nr:hypothetical protein SARC_03613 [Sphaeroforma arctica JP610]KNC84157.1 hypothetical protein SARC_03613 [Sphaeroforma arctica JP610]|eukprot:XP_014158059.1 hypothetical protein SARC_03613 [Sphaeroforma arctica JP610]